jgi:hypothetical protein
MFFDTRSFSEPKLSLETYREWASTIASDYLRNGITPTASLTKIAQSEELTPYQIELLAAEANKLIHTQKYASETSKYHAADFPHADAKQTNQKLAATTSGQVVADVPDPVVKVASVDEHRMFGITPEVMDKTASVRAELMVAQEKVDLLQQKGADRAFLAKTAAADSERAFIKEARQLALGGTSSAERMQILGLVDHFVKTAEASFARPSLAKLAYVLGKEGLLWPEHAEKAVEYFLAKEADIKAPSELISPLLPARVINGNHPLYISLKTFRESDDAARMACQRYGLVKDTVESVRQRIRAL